MTNFDPRVIHKAVPKKGPKHDPLHMQEGLTHCWCMCGACWEPLQCKCICMHCACRAERLKYGY